MSTPTNDSNELRWLIPVAVIAAVLPFAAVLAGLEHAREGYFWWLILGVSVFAVAFPLAVRGLVSLLPAPHTRPRP